jgi:hypothetical protein
MVTANVNRTVFKLVIQIIFTSVKKCDSNATLIDIVYRNDTYRVFTLSVHKTTSKFYVNITIADNATIMNTENKPVTTWLQREKGESKVINNYVCYS